MNSTRLIILNTSPYGGIGDYLHLQANALNSLGAQVTMVGVAQTGKRGDAGYDYVSLWIKPRVVNNRLIRRIFFLLNILANTRRFYRFLRTRSERCVIFGAYFEYAAPFWAWRFRKLASEGWQFATIIHDPVRDYVVGPEWWHRWSISAAYSFPKIGFLHGSADAVLDCPDLNLISLPFGPYSFPSHDISGHEIRQSLGIPAESKTILSFGHIRDGKNLDLLMRAISGHPDLHLIIAGEVQSSGQKSAEFYKSLAAELDIEKRCYFEIRYIDESEMGGFFEAADLIALTYSAAFRSASAVLASCIHYRKPCIASSGPGPLKDLINEYQLGIWVEPDSITAIDEGITAFLNSPPIPLWERFDAENSWMENARIVLKSLNENS